MNEIETTLEVALKMLEHIQIISIETTDNLVERKPDAPLCDVPFRDPNYDFEWVDNHNGYLFKGERYTRIAGKDSKTIIKLRDYDILLAKASMEFARLQLGKAQQQELVAEYLLDK